MALLVSASHVVVYVLDRRCPAMLKSLGITTVMWINDGRGRRMERSQSVAVRVEKKTLGWNGSIY